MQSNESNVKREEGLFALACQLKGSAQYEFLRNSCGSNQCLRRRVEQLLAADADRGKLVDSEFPGLTEVGFKQPVSSGDQIANYQLLRQVCHQGMGIVFLAHRKRDRRHPGRANAASVAVKVPAYGINFANCARHLELESRIISSIGDHPNLVQLIEFGYTDGGLPFLVMEWITGTSLLEQCDQRGLGLSARMAALADVCVTVEHVHRAGYIHCDIKPANIMASMCGGRLKTTLIDFGIAQPLGNRGVQHALARGCRAAGTLTYMSPEQAGDKAVDLDVRSDVYALGCVMHELIHGQPPGKSKTFSISDPVLDKILRTALAQNRTRRFVGVGELRQAIEDWLEQKE